MKWLQNGNLAKMVAFFVIATVITCTVSFAANGWQSFTTDPDSDNIVTDNIYVSDNVDENKDGDSENQDIPVVAPQTKYYHYLTGLETTVDDYFKKPLCVLYSSRDPLYGLSYSYMTIEFPTEHGNTRLLAFTDDAESLGKIGSIAPSRGYISNIVASLGGVLLSYGNDDVFEYDHRDTDGFLDFAATSGYCYTEYNTLVYTNGDLVTAFLQNTKTNSVSTGKVIAPYQFNNVGVSTAPGNQKASNVVIHYSDTNSTEFFYSDTENKYMFSKNSGAKNDLLNDKPISYDNLFILYADSTTYETSDSTQLILDTLSGGKGAYISNGTMISITWAVDSSGNLIFSTVEGSKLTINRGTSYIAFAKSSGESSVKIS